MIIHGCWAQGEFVKVCQLLGVGHWFPPGTPVSSTSEANIFIIISPPRYDPDNNIELIIKDDYL